MTRVTVNEEEAQLVVDLPIKPREITAITAAVRYGQAGPGTLIGWYGVITIPGLDGVIPLGPHATEEQADKELRERLALMREQLTGQGVESEGFELSDQGRD